MTAFESSVSATLTTMTAAAIAASTARGESRLVTATLSSGSRARTAWPPVAELLRDQLAAVERDALVDAEQAAARRRAFAPASVTSSSSSRSP